MNQDPFVYNFVLYVGLPAIIILGILSPFVLRRAPYWQYITLFVLGYGYVVGKACGILIVGPRFVRWYLADLGFVSIFAYIPLLTAQVHRCLGQESIIRARKYALFAFLVAMSQELFMILVQGGKPSRHAAGDWMDVVCYITMYPVTLWLLSSLSKTFAIEDQIFEEKLLAEKKMRRKERKKKLKHRGF